MSRKYRNCRICGESTNGTFCKSCRYFHRTGKKEVKDEKNIM